MEKNLRIKWDISKPSGDKKRLMSTQKAEKYNIFAETNLSDGIKKTIEWYKLNYKRINERYNSFTEKK